VRRDAHGVPHIEAATEDDLFVAQGYVTAQDRLWQMDAFRRNANGELAEVMGFSMVAHDRRSGSCSFAIRPGGSMQISPSKTAPASRPMRAA
jgi:acyl-homoserine lactone acylase PvdQ